MRLKQDTQGRLDFQRSTLTVTNQFFERYESISKILDDTASILKLLHGDLEKVLESERRASVRRGRPCEYTSDNVLRILLCQVVEGASLREIVVRIDTSYEFRRFVRIYSGPMMDFTTLCRLKNAISPKTWKRINQTLAKAAVAADLLDGTKLRLDTTLVETNTRWPSDSGLLWDVYRVMARLIRKARDLDASVVGDLRIREKATKRLHVGISREAGKKKWNERRLKRLYKALIGHVCAILAAAGSVAKNLERGPKKAKGNLIAGYVGQEIATQLKHFEPLGRRVVDQARRRVLQGQQVPATEKVYSIFEPHTELIKRGKAGKPIEFGHMVSLEQVGTKFITGYEVFDRRPTEHTLVAPAVRSHSKLFGAPPAEVAADKAYHSSSALELVADEVQLIAIGNPKHPRDHADSDDNDAMFKLAQAFRAGIEGTISFLKRALRMFRCFDKGWEHFTAAIGRIIFGHNLVVLARAAPQD